MNRLMRLSSCAALVAAAALAAGCGPKPAEIRLKPTRLTVFGLKRTASVIGDVVDKKGNIVPGKTISWESSNPKVATIDAQTGSLTTVAAGRTMITARLAEPPLEAKAPVEVLDVAIVN